MEFCFHHEIKKKKKKGNCDFLSHNSELIICSSREISQNSER